MSSMELRKSDLHTVWLLEVHTSSAALGSALELMCRSLETIVVVSEPKAASVSRINMENI